MSCLTLFWWSGYSTAITSKRPRTKCERGLFKWLLSDDGMCRLYSRKGGPIDLKWGEGERDGTFDREEGLADRSGSHCGVTAKNGFIVILCSECIQYEYTHTH